MLDAKDILWMEPAIVALDASLALAEVRLGGNGYAVVSLPCKGGIVSGLLPLWSDHGWALFDSEQVQQLILKSFLTEMNPSRTGLGGTSLVWAKSRQAHANYACLAEPFKRVQRHPKTREYRQQYLSQFRVGR